MPFVPKKLLLAYDDALGLCGLVVPRMKEMLEHRAFVVDVQALGDTPPDIDLDDYDGLVLGYAVPGLGVRNPGPPPRMQRFLDHLEDLDDKRCALFVVHVGRKTAHLERFRQVVTDLGGEVVTAQPYWVLRPRHNDHFLPAECMVRIR